MLIIHSERKLFAPFITTIIIHTGKFKLKKKFFGLGLFLAKSRNSAQSDSPF